MIKGLAADMINNIAPFPGVRADSDITHIANESAKATFSEAVQLARPNVIEGGVRNIARFLVAQGGTQVTMAHVLQAARTEYRKLGKPINETDFGWLEATGAKA